MTGLVKFQSANLPSPAALSSSLRALENSVTAGGVVILKMDKTGCWVFGADQTEVEDDATWAVNPYSFVHGYIAWGDGVVLGEQMTSITAPLPELGEAPAGAKKGWETQIGVSLKCLSGEDEGLEARYAATSSGGLKAVKMLGLAVAAQVELDQTTPVPVVKLKKEHYQHKKYGRIFTPVFDIISWMPMDSKAVETEAKEEIAEADTKATRRRRSV
jgi:hypothetical protein